MNLAGWAHSQVYHEELLFLLISYLVANFDISHPWRHINKHNPNIVWKRLCLHQRPASPHLFLFWLCRGTHSRGSSFLNKNKKKSQEAFFGPMQQQKAILPITLAKETVAILWETVDGGASRGFLADVKVLRPVAMNVKLTYEDEPWGPAAMN